MKVNGLTVILLSCLFGILPAGRRSIIESEGAPAAGDSAKAVDAGPSEIGLPAPGRYGFGAEEGRDESLQRRFPHHPTFDAVAWWPDGRCRLRLRGGGTLVFHAVDAETVDGFIRSTDKEAFFARYILDGFPLLGAAGNDRVCHGGASWRR